MTNIKSKAQSWSIDIILAVIVFIGAFFMFYAVINTDPNTRAGGLKKEAVTVIKQFGSEDALARIVDNNEVNESRLNELKDLSYDELKRRLRVEGDFCLYIEDEKGNVIFINNSYKGIGSSNINLSGTPCSQK